MILRQFGGGWVGVEALEVSLLANGGFTVALLSPMRRCFAANLVNLEGGRRGRDLLVKMTL